MPLKDIIRTRDELVTATEDESCETLAKRMHDKKVGSVVVERDDRPVGIVTDRDLCIHCVAEGKDAKNTPAKDVMNSKVHTVEGDTGVYEACKAMREHSVRRLPVTENGRLAGIVTVDDMLVLLEDEMHDLSDVVRAESPPYEKPA
ncbi:CBS domain-containing protein [Halobium salinum]|uniref:CBS domain-containing protein n=1 Tax=Halobium salinum TaxID=1364940 RepID=A0ABD5P6J2_9EURY|nr:CBS domain-containing protein [Halobium salinum]